MHVCPSLLITIPAVGCYNARSTRKKIDYARKVKEVYERLVAGEMNESD